MEKLSGDVCGCKSSRDHGIFFQAVNCGFVHIRTETNRSINALDNLQILPGVLGCIRNKMARRAQNPSATFCGENVAWEKVLTN